MNLQTRQKLSELIIRLRGDIPRRAFARELGITATAITSWEQCSSIPDTDNLSKIANKAGYTLEELIEYLNNKPLQNPYKIDRIVQEVRDMPQRELAILNRAVADRFYAIAESVG